MKYAISLLIGFLIAVIIWLYFQKDQGSELKDTDVTQLTKNLQDKVKKAEQLKVSVIVKAREDSAKFEVINRSKDEEIARLKRRAVKAKTVHVDTVIQADPEVGIYIQYLDSVVVSQDSQIAELKEQKVEQWASFNQLISASDSTAQANKELNEFVNKALEGENKRLRRSNNLIKVGVVAVPTAFIAVMLLAK